MFRGRRSSEDAHAGWPGLVDVFAFSFVAVLLVWAASQEVRGGPTAPVEDPIDVAVRTDVRGWLDGLTGALDPSSGGVTLSGDGMVVIISKFPKEEVLFDEAKFDLAQADLERVAAVADTVRDLLSKERNAYVMIVGTADPRPISQPRPPRDNVELSALRATTVAGVLRRKGLTDRVFVRGLGEVTDRCGGAGLAESGSDAYRQCWRVTLEIWHDRKVTARAGVGRP